MYASANSIFSGDEQKERKREGERRDKNGGLGGIGKGKETVKERESKLQIFMRLLVINQFLLLKLKLETP